MGRPRANVTSSRRCGHAHTPTNPACGWWNDAPVRSVGLILVPFSMTPLTPAAAQSFADRWYAAWNAHDADAIMACYDPAIEHSSPFIKRYNGTDDVSLKGIEAVRDYFTRALARNPTLRFDPLHVTTGLESVILVYRRMTGDLAAEIFFLNDAGKVMRSVSHYG